RHYRMRKFLLLTSRYIGSLTAITLIVIVPYGPQCSTAPVTNVAYAPDGKELLVSRNGGDEIEIWDGQGHDLLHTLMLRGHGDRVASVAFSPDGKTVLTGSYDDTAKLWDASSGRLLDTLEGLIASVNSVAFSPDGKTALISDDGEVLLWDVSSGHVLH